MTTKHYLLRRNGPVTWNGITGRKNNNGKETYFSKWNERFKAIRQLLVETPGKRHRIDLIPLTDEAMKRIAQQLEDNGLPVSAAIIKMSFEAAYLPQSNIVLTIQKDDVL